MQVAAGDGSPPGRFTLDGSGLMTFVAILLSTLILVAVAVVLVNLPRWRHARRAADLAQARREFRLRREWLEAEFVSLATELVEPEGIEPIDFEFHNDYAMARNRYNGELQALVAVTIEFAATDMQGLVEIEQRGRVRTATAVFRRDPFEWTTDGCVVLNLNPEETLKYYGNQLESID
jgi:hypothetical protein